MSNVVRLDIRMSNVEYRVARHSNVQWIFIFVHFFVKTGFVISCKLLPLETIRIKCQNLFSMTKKIVNLSSVELA